MERSKGKYFRGDGLPVFVRVLSLDGHSLCRDQVVSDPDSQGSGDPEFDWLAATSTTP